MQKITLFIPSRIYGGAERQMALLACQAADDGLDVTVVDSKIAIVAKILEKRSDIRVLTLGKDQIEIVDSIVITQASYTFCLNTMLKMVRCDVRFWFMHPLNLPHMYLTQRLPYGINYLFKAIYRNTYAKDIQAIKSSLYFQGEGTKEAVEKFYNIKLKNNCTGLLSADKNININYVARENSGFELCWLGRLDNGSKFIIVKKLLEELSYYSGEIKVKKIHIVGDGPARRQLEKTAVELEVWDRVTFHGHVEYEQLAAIIGRAVLLFAHGTSVYEGVVNCTPVAVVDFLTDEKQLESMKYRLYSDDDYLELGYLISDEYDPQNSIGSSFSEILTRLMSEKARREIALAQIEKYRRACAVGQTGIRKLFDEFKPEAKQPSDRLLDVSFFKVRACIIKIRGLFA